MNPKLLSLALVLILLLPIVMARSYANPYAEEREYHQRELMRRILNAVSRDEVSNARRGWDWPPSGSGGSRAQMSKFRCISFVHRSIKVLF